MKGLAMFATLGLLAGVARAQDARLATPAATRDYDFADQAVFPLVAMPGRITDIVLEPGEVLTGPIAAGDTARWIIADTASGAGAARRVHVLVKPTAAPLATNLLIMSDRRTYHLELRASARTWFSQVGWRYPVAAPVLVLAPPAPATPLSIPDPADTTFTYRIDGRSGEVAARARVRRRATNLCRVRADDGSHRSAAPLPDRRGRQDRRPDRLPRSSANPDRRWSRRSR